MQRQTYLLRKGARYHFRRRFTLDGAKRSPITVPLATAEPVEARHLVRRLAVKWDDVAVKIDESFERGTLTIDEQRTLMRQALEEELAHATRHLALPNERSADSSTHRKVLIAAYTIVANMPHDAEKLSREQVERHLDDTWSKAERDLLIRTLTLYITPMVVSRSDAHNALERLDAPINEGTLTEARRALIGGRIEAQRRAALVDHPMFADRNVPAAHLLDDELVEEPRRSAIVSNARSLDEFEMRLSIVARSSPYDSSRRNGGSASSNISACCGLGAFSIKRIGPIRRSRSDQSAGFLHARSASFFS